MHNFIMLKILEIIIKCLIFIVYIIFISLYVQMCSLRDNLKEFVSSLRDTEMKLDVCPSNRADMQEELKRALEVFQEKYEELARQMAWLISVVYSSVSLANYSLRTVYKYSIIIVVDEKIYKLDFTASETRLGMLYVK